MNELLLKSLLSRLTPIRPLPSLCEAWLESTIDASLWTVVNPLTGTAWTIATHATGHRVAYAHPALSENCQLYAKMAQIVCPVALQTDSVVKKAVLEFEMKLTTVANIVNASFFVGFGTAASTRTFDYIIGWGLAADALVSVTDDGGVETTATGFGETLTNFNKLRVELSYQHARFFLNETQIADHRTNLPALANLFTAYMATEAGGDAYIYLGPIRTWMEDVL